jgi:hypothetical protein
MKRMNINKVAIISLACLLSLMNAMGQDSTKRDMVLNLAYFMNNNKVVHINANTKSKIEKKFQPVGNTVVNLYLDAESDSTFIGKVVTNKAGVAKAILPPTLQQAWSASPNHTLIGISQASREFESVTTELAITKSKITIDTISDGPTKSITVTVLAQKDSGWSPAADVEMKVGIQRLGGILTAGDDPTYTTDSSGTVTVEMKKDSLPGDKNGNLVLVARVEDNEPFGNLMIEKTVPWGKAFTADHSFFTQRALWTTRSRTPAWLLVMAYSIVVGVWSTIIYLVLQLIKIKKLGLKEN